MKKRRMKEEEDTRVLKKTTKAQFRRKKPTKAAGQWLSSLFKKA